MPELNTYFFDDLEVQSYFDEDLTRRLYQRAREKGKLGRTSMPRRVTAKTVDHLLWEKKFRYEGKGYIVQGGGKRIAFFENIPVYLQKEAKQDYQRCLICNMRHPGSDLVETEEGPYCQPCYDACFPKCKYCDTRLELPEGTDPGDGPFICQDCQDNEADL